MRFRLKFTPMIKRFDKLDQLAKKFGSAAFDTKDRPIIALMRGGICRQH